MVARVQQQEVAPSSGIFAATVGPIIEVTIARAEEGNRLPPVAIAALNRVLERAEDDESIAGLVLRGEGRDFCSGGVFSDPGSTEISPDYKPSIGEFYSRWATRSFPVLSIAQGSSTAFGCAVALSSDISIVSDTATFQLPELGNGLVPVYAISLLATRFDFSMIRDLVLTRRAMSASRALELGAVTEVFPVDEIAGEVERYVEHWKSAGAKSLRQAIRTFRRLSSAPTPAAVKEIADEGLDELFRRVRAGESDQTYLEGGKHEG